MRRFEYTDEKSAKFWEVEQSGFDLKIRWGRVGAAGQSRTKAFADAANADAAMLKLVTEKTTAGYLETAGAAVGPAMGTTAAKPAQGKPAPATGPVATGAPAPTAPVESMDQQIERGFESIRAQIADGSIVPGADLSIAKIRRAHRISELAASQVNKHLMNAGLIMWWGSVLTPDARQIATAMAGDGGGAAQAPAAAVASATGAAPWLAQGEPLRLGGTADNIVALARATRRHPQPVDAADPQDSWNTVRPWIGARVTADFSLSDPALRDTFKAAWNSLRKSTLGGTPRTDAVLLAMSIAGDRYDRYDMGGQVVDYLVARHGLPHVIDAELEAMRYRITEHCDHYGERSVSLGYRALSAAGRFDSIPWSDSQWRLRTHLAAAAQEVYDACAAKVRLAMGALAPECQIALALQFPDLPEMTHGLIAQWGGGGDDAIPAVHWLQLTATDPAALAQARAIQVDGYHGIWSLPDMVGTILLEHRLDAVRWLAPGAMHDAAGDALARIGTPEALAALARVATSAKPALARFALAVDRWPVAAAAALARYLSGNSKDHDVLLPLLVDLVRNDPSLPAQLQPWLEPGANGLLETVRARLAGPLDVASAEDLPAVLAHVPWLQAQKKSAGSVPLATLSLAPVEHWEEDEKDEILELDDWLQSRYGSTVPSAMAERLGFWLNQPTPESKAAHAAASAAIARGQAPDLLAAWRRQLEEKKKERRNDYSLDGHAVAHLPPALGIPFWNAAASEAPGSGADFIAATWGLAALPGLLVRIASAPSDNLHVALHFGVVELGPIAARAFAKLKSLRDIGREWLERFPEHAACALIAPALGKPNEARDCAAASLRYLASLGHLALLEQVAARYARPEVLPALHAMLRESPLQRYPAKRPGLPAFWKPGGWTRPLLHNGKALPDAALEALGTMMGFPTNEEIYEGLYQVKAACTPDSLADFAWDCFSAWLNASAPSKDGWAMAHLGLFGSDDTARKLIAFIRAWPGEAAHARAVAGLDVLAAIGSDVALMLLNGIAQKVKSKGLQDHADDKILEIAEARGLTPEELEDRLAPDLGLDDQGSMLLDFGPRMYQVGFDESLKPYVREWQDGKAGARLRDLPKPKNTDDAALAGEAAERFKLLKKDARTIAGQQVLRLELAMCARRRWSAAVFAQFLVQHPLVRHLVRRLVWGVYAMPLDTSGESEDAESRVASYGGTLLGCFRVAEDGQYTSAEDDPYAVPEGAQVSIGLPHALELPADQGAAFGQLLADYELLQPFPQLGRDTYALTEAERHAYKLLRWKDAKVASGKVLGLANSGWRRGPTQDGGCILTYDKPADTGRALELNFEPGIAVGMVEAHPEQTLGQVTLGAAQRGHWAGSGDPASFGTLDAIVASELIRDMERLCS